MESRLGNHEELARFLILDGELPNKLHELCKVPGSLLQRSFEDEAYSWTILGMQVPIQRSGLEFIKRKFGKGRPVLDDYQRAFNEYFGDPIKEVDETVLSKEQELTQYIEFLNRMNGFLFGGIAIEQSHLTLEQLAICLIQQQGGIMRPLVNLFDGQTFYGKRSENPTRLEMTRICPFVDNTRATIEYMVCMPK